MGCDVKGSAEASDKMRPAAPHNGGQFLKPDVLCVMGVEIIPRPRDCCILSYNYLRSHPTMARKDGSKNAQHPLFRFHNAGLLLHQSMGVVEGRSQGGITHHLVGEIGHSPHGPIRKILQQFQHHGHARVNHSIAVDAAYGSTIMDFLRVDQVEIAGATHPLAAANGGQFQSCFHGPNAKMLMGMRRKPMGNEGGTHAFHAAKAWITPKVGCFPRGNKNGVTISAVQTNSVHGKHNSSQAPFQS